MKKQSILSRILFALCLLFSFSPLLAQDGFSRKAAVEVSVGFGKTFFFGDLADQEEIRDQQNFSPNMGTNVSIAFYKVLRGVPGLGLGARARFFSAMPSNGDGNMQYFFNYYHAGFSGKYFISNRFAKGLYVKAEAGIGQMTEKYRTQDESTLIRHQFALGMTYLGGLGYAFRINDGFSIFAELEYDYSKRRGDVQGEGERNFNSGQLGFNLGASF